MLLDAACFGIFIEEAALRFTQQLDTCADLAFWLQGHSLGGSLGTLLMLMCVIRKVVPPLAIGPVYTFGAPAIFCESESCRLQVLHPLLLTLLTYG